eukprot:ctg_2042.g534
MRPPTRLRNSNTHSLRSAAMRHVGHCGSSTRSARDTAAPHELDTGLAADERHRPSTGRMWASEPDATARGGPLSVFREQHSPRHAVQQRADDVRVHRGKLSAHRADPEKVPQELQAVGSDCVAGHGTATVWRVGAAGGHEQSGTGAGDEPDAGVRGGHVLHHDPSLAHRQVQLAGVHHDAVHAARRLRRAPSVCRGERRGGGRRLGRRPVPPDGGGVSGRLRQRAYDADQ